MKLLPLFAICALALAAQQPPDIKDATIAALTAKIELMQVEADPVYRAALARLESARTALTAAQDAAKARAWCEAGEGEPQACPPAK